MKVDTLFVKTLFASILLCFSAFSANAKELPFPNYPEKFVGCMDNNARSLFAVSKNEGDLINIGLLPIIQTPRNGVHAMITVYSPSKDYGYNLSDKANGKWCVIEKLTNYSWKKAGNFQVLAADKSFSKEECNFTPRYTDTCGSFSRLSGALLSKGFTIDFQAINEKGHIDIFLSGENKAYRLTTHAKTGATVITGNGTSAFVFHTDPTSP